MTPWDRLLRDIDGAPARPGEAIRLDGTGGADSFHLSGLYDDYRSPTVAGTEMEGLAGSGGLPVTGARLVADADGNGYSYEFDPTRTLIHPADIHSLMSDHGVRNSNFLEIELAAFQDLGYTIDRSLSYGTTFYRKLNYDPQLLYTGGDDWESPLAYAVGVHILTDDLTYVQTHDIHASGTAAGGIRIDGIDNTLWINPTGSIRADGDRGTGLLVAYGHGNVVIHRGTIEAGGNYGYGVHFEAGPGDAGPLYEKKYDKNDYDPSVLREDVAILRDLSGALVSRFDVTGSIYGKSRSISIGKSAYVEEINIMSGAVLRGDIVSEYVAKSPCEAATRLTFGRLPTEAGVAPGETDIRSGVATNAADPDFLFVFDGAVRGKTNIDMETVGGITAFSGSQVQFRNGIIGRNSALIVQQRVEFGGNLEIDDGASLAVFADENWHSLLKADGKAFLTGGRVAVFGKTARNLPYEFIRATDGVYGIRQITATLFPDDPATGYATDVSTDSGTGIALRSGFTPWSYWYRQRGIEHPFRQYAATWNETSIAAHLDSLRSTARNDMEYLQAHLDVLLDEGRVDDYRRAVNELGGEIYGSLGIMAVQGLTIQNGTLANSLRQTHLCTSRGTPHRYDAWIIGYGLGGNGYDDGNAHAVDYGVGGTIVGIGARSDHDDRVGFYFSYGRAHLTADRVRQSVRSDDFIFGGFLKLRVSKGYWLGFAGGGFNAYSAHRRITYVDREANGDHRGGQAVFYLERGMQIRTKIAAFQPFIALQYAGVYQERFHETGAGAANLQVENADTDSLRMVLGTRVAKNFYAAGCKITGEVHGSWIHEYFDKTATPIRTRFTDYGGASFHADNSFDVYGLDVGRDWGYAGFSVQCDNGVWRGFLGYDIQVNECVTLHTGSGGITYGW